MSLSAFVSVLVRVVLVIQRQHQFVQPVSYQTRSIQSAADVSMVSALQNQRSPNYD